MGVDMRIRMHMSMEWGLGVGVGVGKYMEHVGQYYTIYTPYHSSYHYIRFASTSWSMTDDDVRCAFG